MSEEEVPEIFQLVNRETAAAYMGGEKALDARVEAGTIIEIALRGGGNVSYGYPIFQFGKYGGIHPVVGAINVLLMASENFFGAFAWWTTPHPNIADGKAPLELVNSPDWMDQNAILQLAIAIVAPDEYSN